MIRADSSCALVRGQLSCKRPITTGDYTMWVVPETLAGEAGPDALQRLASAGQAQQAPRAITWSPLPDR